MENFLANLQLEFARERPEDAAQAEPCLPEEIDRLEGDLSIRLPLAYREYLLWMGRDGSFLSVMYHSYRVLRDINLWAREIIERDKPGLQLPSRTFVFALDTSPMFYFFGTEEGDNPPVYLFIESDLKKLMSKSNIGSHPSNWDFLFDERIQEDFILFSPSFTQHLEYEMREYVRIMRENESYREAHKSELSGQDT